MAAYERSVGWFALKNNIFRWYRSGWGKYTQADPIGLTPGTNLFAYVKGNPVFASDPWGLVPVTYTGESNKQIQIKCQSASALGCTCLDAEKPSCSCAAGCDPTTHKQVWAANPEFKVSGINVFFSTDCYYSAQEIKEHENLHVALIQKGIEAVQKKAAALNGKTFGSEMDCKNACMGFEVFAWENAYGSKFMNSLIDIKYAITNPKNCSWKLF